MEYDVPMYDELYMLDITVLIVYHFGNIVIFIKLLLMLCLLSMPATRSLYVLLRKYQSKHFDTKCIVQNSD